MKITQIVVTSFEGGSDIYGLGDDNKVYIWDSKGEWIL